MKYLGHKSEYFKKQREQYRCYTDAKGYRPSYFSNNSHNEAVALEQRVLKEMIQPDPLIMGGFVQFVKTHLFDFIPKKKIRSDSISVYLKNSNATPATKRRVEQAHLDLTIQGVTGDTSLSYDRLRKLTSRKSFVKIENALYRSPLGFLEKGPRLIQGAQPGFIAIVGPWFSSFQRHLKRSWNEHNFIHFTSGSSSAKMGKHIDVENWNIFENDVSAYDASISLELGSLEVWVAEQFGAPRAVIDLMRANLMTHGMTSHGFSYSVPGTRKSGDPYTSCFNSMLNVFMHLFAFHVLSGREVRDMKHHIKFLVQGDDILCRHSGAQLSGWYDIFYQLGFKTESFYRQHLYDAEFCSSVCVPVEGGYSFVPKLGSVVTKLGYFISPPNVPVKRLLKGVGLGFGHLDNLPLFSGLVSGILKYSGHVAPIYPKDFEHKYKFDRQVPNLRTTHAIYSRYGLTLEMGAELESALRERDFNHPYVSLILDRDTSAPREIFAPMAG